MGGAPSKKADAPAAGKDEKAGDARETPATVVERVNKIAADYIAHGASDFYRFKDPRYCDELVVLTSNALNKQLTSFELAQLDTSQKEGGSDERVWLTTQRKTKDIGLRRSERKRKVCARVARFYVQIAHVFAAIQAAVSPEDPRARRDEQYYDPYYGDRSRREGRERRRGDTGRAACARRLMALKPTVRPDGAVVVEPSALCGVNKPSTKPGADGRPPTTSAITQEFAPGFAKLEALYDDVWDTTEGRFKGKSPDMRKRYEADVLAFFRALTGGDPPRDDAGNSLIKHFDSIPLEVFSRSPQCMAIEDAKRLRCEEAEDARGCAQRKVNGVGGCEWKPGAGRGDFTGECVLGKAALYRLGRIEGGQDVGVFRAYGEHYKKMLQAAGKNKDALNQILDKLFVTYEDPALTERERITLRPDLSRDKLAKIIEETRGILTNLYISCEKDFRTGVKLMNKIIEKRMSDLQVRRLAKLAELEQAAIAGEPAQAPGVDPGAGERSRRDDGKERSWSQDAARAQAERERQMRMLERTREVEAERLRRLAEEARRPGLGLGLGLGAYDSRYSGNLFG